MIINFVWNYIELMDVSFKDFSIFSSGGHFVQWRRTVRATLLEGLMSVKLVWSGDVV